MRWAVPAMCKLQDEGMRNSVWRKLSAEFQRVGVPFGVFDAKRVKEIGHSFDYGYFPAGGTSHGKSLRQEFKFMWRCILLSSDRIG